MRVLSSIKENCYYVIWEEIFTKLLPKFLIVWEKKKHVWGAKLVVDVTSMILLELDNNSISNCYCHCDYWFIIILTKTNLDGVPLKLLKIFLT